MSEVDAEKAALREGMRAHLRDVLAEAAEAASLAVLSRLAATSVWRDARVVALYSDLPGEVPTEGLIRAAREKGARVVLPRVSGTGEMFFAELGMGSERVRGRFGVLEPAAAMPAVALAEIDLFVVPGLAFDRSGGRLGRGAGYYDRALAAASSGAAREEASDQAGGRATCRAVGVAFDLQVVDRVPMGPLDVRLDGLLTESATYGLG